MKGNDLTILAHPKLFYTGIIFIFFLVAIVNFIIVVFLNLPSAFATSKDQKGCIIIFVIIEIGIFIAGLLCLPRWCVRITFNENNVVFKTVFSKAKENTYESYRYIYKASYLHMLYRPQYIVFSQTRLSNYELENINQITPSEKTIKIRYNKKIFKALQQVLPEKQRMKMEQCFK